MKKIGSFLLSISSLILLLLIFVPVIISYLIEPSVATLILLVVSILLTLLFAIWVIVVMGIYIAHATKCEQLDGKKKGIWITLLIIFSLFVFPVYWYLYIRTDKPKQK